MIRSPAYGSFGGEEEEKTIDDGSDDPSDEDNSSSTDGDAHPQADGHGVACSARPPSKMAMKIKLKNYFAQATRLSCRFS